MSDVFIPVSFFFFFLGTSFLAGHVELNEMELNMFHFIVMWWYGSLSGLFTVRAVGADLETLLWRLCGRVWFRSELKISLFESNQYHEACVSV